MRVGLYVFFGIYLLFLFSACRPHPEIVQRPIPYPPAKAELSLAYLADRYGLIQDAPVIDPQIVVIHHTNIPTLEGTYEVFEPVELPGARDDIAAAARVNVSAQYIVDRDGTIYQLMADTLFARHTIGLNWCAIGIENVGGTPETPLTKAQLRANIWLVRKLSERHPIEYLIGHHEYRAMEQTPLWKERDQGYRTEKDDPGPEFMRSLRQKLQDLELKKLPKL